MSKPSLAKHLVPFSFVCSEKYNNFATGRIQQIVYMKKEYVKPTVSVQKLECEGMLLSFSVAETDKTDVYNESTDGPVL